MRNIETMQRIFYSLVTAGFLLGTVANAWYMPSAADTTFELDGNITDDAGNPGDDWTNIKVGPNNAFADTGIIEDPINTTIFTGGGSKDVRPISAWKHTEGSVPDKNEILNAAAAAYVVEDNGDDDLVIYLHGDRFSNDGAAQMGIWFFQDRIVAEPDGTFSGAHHVGDILMLANFVHGGANAEVQILEWNPDHPKAKKNLLLLAKGEGGIGTDFYYYATSNAGPTESWDSYTPKALVEGYPVHTYPENSFFEGAINISWLFDGKVMPCFSTFLMETRSSPKPDAQLKDFVYGSLDTCKLEVSKSCISSALNQDTYETLDHNYSYTVTNSGFGTMTNVVVHDDAGTPGYIGDDLTFNIGTLIPGQEITDYYQVTSSLNPPTNSLYASSATIVKTETASATCQPVALSPTIDVTKDCNQSLESLGGYTVVKLMYNGQVCNMSVFGDANATKLINVTVADDKSGLTHTITETLYPQNDPNPEHKNCAPYSGMYYPSEPSDPSGDQCENSYEDTVTASGDYLIGGDLSDPETNTTTDTRSANCGLCVDCQ